MFNHYLPLAFSLTERQLERSISSQSFLHFTWHMTAST